MSFLQNTLRKLHRHKLDPLVAREQASSCSVESNKHEYLLRYRPLLELQQKRQLLEVICAGESYQSLILDTIIFDADMPSVAIPYVQRISRAAADTRDAAGGVLVLDDPFPANPAHPIRVGDELTLRHHSNGKVLTFTSPLVDIVHNMSTPLYMLKLPHDVAYRERRQSPRVSLSRHQPLTVKLQSPLRTPWFATVHNLSAGGMRLAVGGNIIDYLQHNRVLPLCEFQFNRDFRVCCPVAVRSFRFVRRPYRHTQISVEFIDMAPYQRFQLQQFVQAMLNNRARAA